MTVIAVRGVRVRPWPVWAAAAGWTILYAFIAASAFGYDSHAYWLTRSGIVYRATGVHDRYLYSPAFAEVLRPLTLMPWPVFAALWAVLGSVIYLWLLRGLDWQWRLPFLCLCFADVVFGNVWSLFALVCVLGFRWPGLWAIALLTKVTPAVGLVWFAVRREWRRLAIVLAWSAAIAVVSVLIAPDLWLAWFRLLTGGGDPSLYPRVTAGVAVSAYAALKSRPALIPVAVILATPVVSPNALAVLAAIPAINRYSSGRS